MKNVGKYACMTALAGALVACDPGITIEGRWVEPIPGMKGVQGFELKKGGEASSINMATLRYKSWEQSGQSLILSGESIGNGVIRITDKETKVTCATSPSGTNLVSCSSTFTYKCEAGYYGNPTAFNKTCTKCPSPGTSAEGSTSQSDCYIPAGTTGSDSSGTYKYVSDCHYS